MRLDRRLVIALKQLRLRFGAGGRAWYWRGTSGVDGVDYASAVGEGRGSAAVMACVLWLARTFPEAPVRVQKRRRDGDLEPLPNHPLAARLAAPNESYSGPLLWMATIGDWMLTGNAYWAVVRAPAGNVRELWWLPAHQVTPQADANGHVSHYDYAVGGRVDRLALDDVVHFRYGLDPDNPLKGLSPIASLLREVFTDQEAGSYTATILRNLGVPGAVLTFEEGGPQTQDQADKVKADYESRFTGPNRGRVLVLAGKTRLERVAFNPTELDLKSLRRVPEERITAIFGIPAVVVGLGAGLDRSTFANYAEAREAAYESNVIPTQRLFAAELQAQLLPLMGDETTEVVGFDNGDVRVLQPDQDALYRRLDVGVQGGWLTVNEAREEVGLDPLPDGDVLYVKSTNTPTDPAELVPPEPAPTPPALEGGAAPLRALPPPKAQLKSARGMTRGLHRVRTRYLGPMTADVAAYLGRQQAAALGRIGAGAKEVTRFGDPDEVELRALLEAWYARVLRSVHALAEDELGAVFDLGDPVAQQYLQEAGANVVGIAATTRDALAASLREGYSLGEGVDQLAQRIRDLPAFGQARARMVARTELAYATQYAAIDSYRASGLVTHVDVLDGDSDGPCAAANGQRWTLEEARGRPIEHPNCVRAFAPVVGEDAA